MHERLTTPQQVQRVGSASLGSFCTGCRNEADIHIAQGVVEGPGGSRGAITYADTDIVVWECPGCGAANADTCAD